MIARQPVMRNPAAQMVYVMHADIGTEPAQGRWQIVMRATMQRCFVLIPAAPPGPERILELVLDVESHTPINVTGKWISRNRPIPTSQITMAATTATAALVPIVLAQGTHPAPRIIPTGSRCCRMKR